MIHHCTICKRKLIWYLMPDSGPQRICIVFQQIYMTELCWLLESGYCQTTVVYIALSDDFKQQQCTQHCLMIFGPLLKAADVFLVNRSSSKQHAYSENGEFYPQLFFFLIYVIFQYLEIKTLSCPVKTIIMFKIYIFFIESSLQNSQNLA